MIEQQKALSVNSHAGFGKLVGCFGMLFGFVFCSMFFGMGCLFLWMIALHPLLNIQAAKSWTETPCTITKSEVEGNENYRITIEYDYSVGGQDYHGDRYDFFSMGTSGRTSKERIVAKYKIGTIKKCYVNPENPSESVLNRDASADLWWGLFPVPFILVGLIGYWGIFFGRGIIAKKIQEKQAAFQNPAFQDSAISSSSQSHSQQQTGRIASQSEWSDSNYDEEDLFEDPGPVTLENESSPFILAIFLFFFAAFWNGIVSVFLFQRVNNWKQLDFGFQDLFMVPFVLVGIGVFLAFLYNLMAGFNPKPILTLSRQLIPLGGTAELEWKFPSSIGSIRNLTLTITGIEEATYRRGTNTYTDHETFCENILFETSDPLEMMAGKIEINIPTDSMHSFNGGNNKIIWRLELKGDIPFWPDVSAKFPIRVVPHE